jgi:hypothetical protein
MPKQVVVQKGTGRDLFVYFNIEPAYIADEAKVATSDTVVGELWGAGTTVYRSVIAGYGGWKKYVAGIATKVGVDGFGHVCLTTWSAGSEILKMVCRGADLPDAIVSLDGIYGHKPPNAKPGDGNVLFDAELEGIARYALAAARGEKVFVLLHSSIGTPYGSSGEVAHLIRAFVERELGKPMELDRSLNGETWAGPDLADALVLGNFHMLEFVGADAKEHVKEAHLFDEVWRRWIPWAMTDEPITDPAPPPSAPTTQASSPIEVGSTGDAVKRWQTFLVGQGARIVADGVFGPRTLEATKAWQRGAGVVATGVVDEATLDAARARGLGEVHESDWPPPPSFPPLVTNMERARVFGSFAYVPSPVPSNPEGIRITDGWDRLNIVSVVIPQISTLQGGPKDGRVQFHKLVAERAKQLFAKWEELGLLSKLLTWGGSWAPRFVRGSNVNLSNHAFGTAFDVNVAWNMLGAVPAAVGTTGSVRELVGSANDLGFYWGGHFKDRVDGMHFELARL